MPTKVEGIPVKDTWKHGWARPMALLQANALRINGPGPSAMRPWREEGDGSGGTIPKLCPVQYAICC